MPGMTSRTATGSGAAGGSRSSFGLGRHSATASHRTSTGSSRRGRGAVAGPGSPILCILGGEGAVPPSTGIFYPFVTDVLAKRFNALVVQPEHRFYGTSL